MLAIALRVVRRRCWYTLHMGPNEHSHPSGLLAWFPAIVKRAFGGESEPTAESEHPPLRDKPGPSGLPPAPPRVEKRGL